MSIIPSEVEFGPGNIERAVGRQAIEFVPFVEKVNDRPGSLSELLGRTEGEHALSEVARVEIEDVIRYISRPSTRAAPLLVTLARDPDRSLGSLAASTRRGIREVELGLEALQELGIVVKSIANGVERYSLREDLTEFDDS